MSVRIERKGRRIEVRSDERLKRLQALIPGAYETVHGYWTVPLDLATCALLRQEFGNRLDIGTELRRWAVGVTQSRKSMVALAAADSAKLEVLPTAAPKLYAAMQSRGYQLSGTRFVADSTATLVADDPGLGKTLIAMGGILEAKIPGPYLVVAPTTASDSVWAREIARWLPSKHRPVTVPKMRLQRERVLRETVFDQNTWLIIHPEMCMTQAYVICKECKKRHVDKGRNQRQLPCGHMRANNTTKELVYSYPELFLGVQWGTIVVDECHESLIKRGGQMTQRRRGLEVLPLREQDSKRIALSGTPCDSKPHQLWGILNWLYPKQYSGFGRWAEMYWEKGGFQGYEIGAFRKERESLLWSSLSDIALRRTKSEVAKDLPPKTYVGTPLDPEQQDSPIGIWLPMEGKQERAYREIEKYSATELDSGRLEAFTALGELTRLKQLASSYGTIRQTVRGGMPWYQYDPIPPSNKLTWILESLEEWGFPHNPITKVVIVSFYSGILRSFAQAIEQHFRRKPRDPRMCMGITGKTPRNLRRKYIDIFNHDSYPAIMMLNVRAGGTAITLDSADRMIFVSETANPDQQSQAEDRIHRVSNPRHCLYYYLRSIGTVDVGTAISNREADAQTHRLLDTRRGVEYVRHILDLSH